MPVAAAAWTANSDIFRAAANATFAAGATRAAGGIGGVGGITGMLMTTASVVYTLALYFGIVAAIFLALRHYFDNGHAFYVDKR